MSVQNLAELIDRLRAEGLALLRESERGVTVSDLSVADAVQIADACDALGWETTIYDTAPNEWQVAELAAALEPFRIEITKPEAPLGTFQLLTNTGFQKWLESGQECSRWHVARLPGRIRTQGALFAPWNDQELFQPSEDTKSPRALVREHGAQRLVPADIRPWLISEDQIAHFEDPAFRVWANAAIRSIVRSLADEIDQHDSTLRFNGRPRLSLSGPSDDAELTGDLGESGFLALQAAAQWVFENVRESEMRHILFATEFARSSVSDEDVISCIKKNAAHALDGAKIAYQMGLSNLSRDTLKALSDLRKSVTDETAKLTETTRQLAAAVAGALAIGLGLVAARLTTNAHPLMIIAVMSVVVVYVAMIILSGVNFVFLQRQLRRDWQPTLYRFLPKSDYDRMVKRPTRKAENAYFWAAGLGALATIVLTCVVFYIARDAAPPVPPVSAEQTDQQAPAITPYAPVPEQQVPAITPNVSMPEQQAPAQEPTDAQ